MNILLLGQETNFRPLLMEALKQAGHGWQFAATWDNADALIQQHTFQCVLLSYSLASEMIEEFIELLNQVCPACPIIAISEQAEMDWKLQPTTMVRADHGFEALIACLAGIEQRARFSPHQDDGAHSRETA
jgi:DNA-binding NtrC family response regulator